MIAYLDCFSGISGDMLLGALIDAGLTLDDLLADIADITLTGYQISANRVVKKGINATSLEVAADKSHYHRRLNDILSIISDARLPEKVKSLAQQAFTRLAKAEGSVHNQPAEEVHFHEVGAVDAIVDIVGAFCGMNRLGIEKVYASPLPLGGGWVESEHGRFPIPAPATVELLKGIPVYGGPVEGELVTPTGAAILTTVCKNFGSIPPMAIKAIGYGAGKKELPHPNLLRLLIGEPTATPQEERLVIIEANLDDMNPELFEHVMDRILGAGALDVFFAPIIMKKSRPATLISVLTDPAQVNALSEILFRETTTLGVRIKEVSRRCLEREWQVVKTEYGDVRVKIGRLGSEIITIAPEYEDCRRLALEWGVPVKIVYEAAKQKFK